ncbi:uncharacterized protein LOC114788827 isoform X1 [Denticeps clupeoides]|uniref:uncharacterized protein LOC114788827 isoform X1 n=2 Tax=Denticeps clupeoides TaxID=299321 RepID=UPI0010A2F4E2|nr:uncharacterized protein LOC114788827 isoform X1 [Denticeps clupeoides]
MEYIMNLLEIAERLSSYCKMVQGNKDQCVRLDEHVSALVKLLHSLKTQGLSEMSEELKRCLTNLKHILVSAEELVKKYNSMGYLNSLWKAYSLNEEFNCLFEQLEDIKKYLSLSLQVEQRQKIGTVCNTMDTTEKKVDSLQEMVDETHKKIDSVYEIVNISQRKLDELHEKIENTPKNAQNVVLVESKKTGPEPPTEDAEKMLLKIRTKFVENVTGVLIKQLLDDLRETRVLNSEEADAVLEENSSRADRARCLMDMVRKKGKKSSERMVSWLKEHDPNLSQSIGLV